MGILQKMSDKLGATIEKMEENGPRFIESIEYLGGHPKLDKNFKGFITFKGNEVVIRKSSLISIIVPLETITDVEFKTQEQVSKDVTLTRLALVGLFAFGMRKKRIEALNYAIITSNDNKIVLRCKNANLVVNKIKERM